MLILIMTSKIKKGSKLDTKTKKSNNKKNVNKLGYIGGLAGLGIGLGIGINHMMKPGRSEPMLTMENVYQDDAIEKEISNLKKALNKEQEANKKLVDHINRCNKEVIRLQGLVSRKKSLCKEALLRSTINKLKNNK